jgi:hypothetical protein
MTQGNNLIATISGIKGDGKTTLGLYLLEMLNKPSLIIDVTEQFIPNRKYKKIIKGVTELKYELLNSNNLKLFKKSKLHLIFRPITDDIKSEIEEVIQHVLKDNIQDICIFFDELEVYANNRLSEKSSIFRLFYMSRNRKIDLISVVKIFGLLSPLIKSQTDYFLLSQIDDMNSEKYLNQRSKNQVSRRLKGIKRFEFLITNLKDQWCTFKLESKSIKTIERVQKRKKIYVK